MIPADIIAWVVGLVVTTTTVGCVRMSSVLDIPNDRSMHKVPTPRGGGLGIVLGFLVGSAILYARPKSYLFDLILAIAIGGIPIAFIGWLDDRMNVSAKWRALVHVVAAAASLGYVMLAILNVAIGTWVPPFTSPWVWWIASTIALAYFLNLYNFMDGLDGLAGSEGVFAGFAGAFILAHRTVANTSISKLYIPVLEQTTPILILVALCCLGFLFWNWPPAKIFMGDVGSGFLGFVFGFLALWSTLRDPGSFAMWLIIFGVFIVDGTTTLVTRALTKQKWYDAHSLHAFQKAAKRLHGKHVYVTLGILMINLGWLFPVALYADSHRNVAFALVAVAYAPLVAIALLFRAGRKESLKQPVAA